MSFLSNEEKCRLLKFQNCLSKIVSKDVLSKTIMATVGMIHLGSGMLEAKIVHKLHSTKKKSSGCKKSPPKFGSNFELISESHKLLRILFYLKLLLN